MKLEVESINIKDMKFDSRTFVSGSILSINPQELEGIILKDSRIRSVKLDIVRPGDRARIVNVVDVIQPRCKVDMEDRDFPGWLSGLKIAGQGRTRSLENVAVILSNRYSKRPYSCLFDMFGAGSEMCPYSRLTNISVDPIPTENVEERDFESAVKIAGLRTAVFLSQSASGGQVDETESFDLDISSLRSEKVAALPRVAYYYQLYTPQHDYQALPDPILYGSQVTNLLPTVIHPNEVLDGAIVSPHTMREVDTYTIQNHPIINELYRRHGKDLIFTGVVIGVATMEPVQRERMAMMAGNLISNVLGADGVILTKVHGGMPHADLGMVAQACENAGIKTVLFAQVWSSVGSLSDFALFGSKSFDAVVNVGQTLERVRLPRVSQILGGTAETAIYNPAFPQRAGDEAIEIEGFLIPGAYDLLGGSKIVAIED